MNKTQCKMARAALGWRAADLADRSGLGYATVARFESGQTIAAESVDKMRSTMEREGVQFSSKAARLIVSVPE